MIKNKKMDINFNNVIFHDEESMKEFKELVYEIYDFGFQFSSEVSKYILDNKLGHKYKSLSGILTFESYSRGSWTMEGGISPDYYGALCSVLGLKNHQTDARPVSFTPYKKMNFLKQRI